MLASPPPVSRVKVPAVTLVVPVKVLTPPRLNKAPVSFMRLPLPLMTPMKLPPPTVSAVGFKVTVPLPRSDPMLTAAFTKFATPSAVSTVEADRLEPLCAFKNAPPATVMAVLASVPLNVNEPAFTSVAPVYALEPLNVSNPPLVFTKLPVPLIAPLNVPLLSVSAVVFKSTTPAPRSVSSVTAAFARFTNPSAVSTVATGSTEPLCAFNVAPFATVNAVLASVPLKVSVPAFTLVAPL